ncbi:MAG: hypothetical protein DMG68_10750 [Acidobacteria bacterium]|nr:MAG: hypothetical protein DMG68_10750 [Acidobacteriota bacterium]
MESGRQLDPIGRTRSTSFVPIILWLCLVLSCVAASQSSPADKLKLEQLLQHEQWQQLIDAIERVPARDADLDYYYGTALAQLGHFEEARKVFLDGQRLQPQDKRFPTELGGVAYKQKRYSEAASWLHRALRLDPHDAYANDFLATIYFLQGNLEAALKYWNRIGKPQIESVRSEQPLRMDPTLLDRAFAFAPASQLRLPDLLTSKARAAGLGVFHVFRF